METGSPRVVEVSGKPPFFRHVDIYVIVFFVIFWLILFFGPRDLTIFWLLIGMPFYVTIAYLVKLNAYLHGGWVASISLHPDKIAFRLASGKTIELGWSDISLRRGRRNHIDRGAFLLQAFRKVNKDGLATMKSINISVTIQQGRTILSHPSCPKLGLSPLERKMLGVNFQCGPAPLVR